MAKHKGAGIRETWVVPWAPLSCTLNIIFKPQYSQAENKGNNSFYLPGMM